MSFSKEEREIISLVDTYQGRSKPLSNDVIDKIIASPSYLVLLLATIVQPHELLQNSYFQREIILKIRELIRSSEDVLVSDQLERLDAFLVLLESSESDFLIDQAFDSKSPYNAERAICCLARADVPWRHPRLMELLTSRSLEVVAAATIVLVEESLSQFYDSSEEITWVEFIDTFDSIWDVFLNQKGDISTENLLKIAWSCSYCQYMQYFDVIFRCRSSFEKKDRGELDAILFSLHPTSFCKQMLENESLTFDWLVEPKLVANVLETLCLASPVFYCGGEEPPVQVDSKIRNSLASGFTSSWLETLGFLASSDFSEAFEFGATLCVSSSSALRAFAIKYAEASVEELDELSDMLSELVVCGELNELIELSESHPLRHVIRWPEFAVANLLTDDPKLEFLLVKIAAQEVLLAMNGSFVPSVAGLPLSGTSFDESDLVEVRRLYEFVDNKSAMNEDFVSSETLVRQVRTAFDAALWEKEKGENDQISSIYEDIVLRLRASNLPIFQKLAECITELRCFVFDSTKEVSKEGEGSEKDPFSHLLALNRCRYMDAERALSALSELWFKPPILSSSIARDAFVAIATDAALIEEKFLV